MTTKNIDALEITISDFAKLAFSLLDKLDGDALTPAAHGARLLLENEGMDFAKARKDMNSSLARIEHTLDNLVLPTPTPEVVSAEAAPQPVEPTAGAPTLDTKAIEALVVSTVEKYLSEVGNDTMENWLAHNLNLDKAVSEYVSNQHIDIDDAVENYLSNNLDTDEAVENYLSNNLDTDEAVENYLSNKIDIDDAVENYLSDKIDTDTAVSDYVSNNIDNLDEAVEDAVKEAVNEAVKAARWLDEDAVRFALKGAITEKLSKVKITLD